MDNRSGADIQAENLLRLMRNEIAKKPSAWRNGFWSVPYPSKAVCRSGATKQRQYVGELDSYGFVIVRDLDGYEFARGSLGFLWSMPVFDELRSRLAAQSKAVV